jgi:hypothetical protein
MIDLIEMFHLQLPQHPLVTRSGYSRQRANSLTILNDLNVKDFLSQTGVNQVARGSEMPKWHGISSASRQAALQPAYLAGLKPVPSSKFLFGFHGNVMGTGLQVHANLACWKGVLRNPELATVCFG